MTEKIGSGLSQEARQRANLDMGGYIVPPFNLINLNWKNGSAEKSGNVNRFGGWKAEANQFAQQCADLGIPVEVTGFSTEDIFDKRDGMVTNYTKRFIYFAFMGMQDHWDTNRMTGKLYNRGNLLGYMANYNHQEKAFEPLAPVMLTAYGFANKRVKEALLEWEKTTGKARRDYAAPGTSPWLFWCPLGTFSDEVKTEMVGKVQQSPITPCESAKPDGEITQAKLASWYVGDVIAELMADYQNQAREWLNVKIDNRGRNAPGTTQGEDESEDDFPEDFDDNEIPF